MDNSGAVFAALGIFSLILLVAAIALAVLQIVAMWKIFTKAGEPGWKSITPFYNMYTQIKFSWKTSMFWVLLALVIVYSVASNMNSESLIANLLVIVSGIALVVIDIMALNKLSKCMGKGAGFTVGLLFLPTIFYMILGFGKSQYIGKQD